MSDSLFDSAGYLPGRTHQFTQKEFIDGFCDPARLLDSPSGVSQTADGFLLPSRHYAAGQIPLAQPQSSLVDRSLR
jgi:hypothetical protein